ncbi:unnamed protein product [Ophioblennius macclurei]
MDGKRPSCRWRCVAIIFTLSVFGFVIQTFVLRDDQLDAFHFLQKVFMVHRWSSPPEQNPRRPADQNQTQTPTQTPAQTQTQNQTQKQLVAGSAKPEAPPPGPCQQKSHVVFLNTHGTDSAAIQNLLYRYGETQGLSFALPKDQNLGFSYPRVFQARFVEGVDGTGGKDFHILCNHMRFNKSEVAKVMPADTLYFSMLRHPVSLAQSAFLYTKVVATFADSATLEALVEDQLRNRTAAAADDDNGGGGFPLNGLAFDLGFDNSAPADAADLERRANEAIVTMERDFHLVLINEYFDESLVLLRHALCWSLEDVATFSRDARGDHNRCSMSAAVAEDVKRGNALDWKIYQHFNATFWRRVESAVGAQQMEAEVAALRELQARLTQTCLKGRAANPSAPWDGRRLNLGFNLNPDLGAEARGRCQEMLTPALQYTYKLYHRQFANED